MMINGLALMDGLLSVKKRPSDVSALIIKVAEVNLICEVMK